MDEGAKSALKYHNYTPSDFTAQYFSPALEKNPHSRFIIKTGRPPNKNPATAPADLTGVTFFHRLR